VKKAIPNYTDEYLRKLWKSLDELNKLESDFEKHTEYNHRFHVMLYTPSNWNRLIGIIVQLRNNTMRYMMLSDQRFYSHGHFESEYSHEKILEACEKRNEEEAERLNREHILNAMRIVMSIAKSD
jgi:DNA-binding GntR family transcriptional regulator